MNAEKAFEQEMYRIYEEAKQFNYYPTRFLGMIQEHGGVGTAKRLLASETVSDGFTRLWAEGRLDLSVEAIVIQDSYSSLFTPELVVRNL